MKQQTAKDFQYLEQQLPLQIVIQLTHYAQLYQSFSKNLLSIVDYDVNLRQNSTYYIQKRRGNALSKLKEDKESKSNIKDNTSSKKPKVQRSNFDNKSEKRLKDSHLKGSQLDSNQKIVIIASDKKGQQVQKSYVKTPSRKKVQVSSTKKIEDFQNSSSLPMKELQKTNLHLYKNQVIQKEGLLLSQFVKSNKIQVTSDNGINKSITSKTEKCAKDKSSVDNNIKSPNEQQQKQYENNSRLNIILVPQSKKQQPPHNDTNYSKSKSKSKVKKPKQTSIINKSPIKAYNMETYQINRTFQAKPSVKSIKQSQNSKKKINLRSQDVIPTQDFQGSPDQTQFNYKDQIEQFAVSQMKPEAEINRNQKQYYIKKEEELHNDNRNNNIDYYSIDMTPLKKQNKQQMPKESLDLPQIKSDLKSKSELSNIKAEMPKLVFAGNQPINPKIDEQKPISVAKSSRKKIFQDHGVKQTEIDSENSDYIKLSDLTDDQMKLLLGAKGNKYKEAIILEYIRQNRKQIK